MQDGNIPTDEGISPGSFELGNLEGLNAPQVDPNQPPGSTTEEPTPYQVEVDPKYAGLPEAEGIARTIQSKYDKLNIDYLNAQKELQSASKYKEVVNDLYESDDALYALLNERKPELISNRDVKSEVTKRLTEKFGEGFKPELSRDEAERQDPGGQDWLYYQELDKVKTDITGSGQYAKHKTLQEFRDAQKAESDKADALIEDEVRDTQTKLKMSVGEVEWNRKWAATLKFEDIVNLSRFVRRFKNAPTMANIPGSQVLSQSKGRQQLIDSLK